MQNNNKVALLLDEPKKKSPSKTKYYVLSLFLASVWGVTYYVNQNNTAEITNA